MGTRFKPRVNSGSVFLTTRLELLVSRNGLKSLSWQCWAGSPDSGTVTTILTCLVMAERAFTKHCRQDSTEPSLLGDKRRKKEGEKVTWAPGSWVCRAEEEQDQRNPVSHRLCVGGHRTGWGLGHGHRYHTGWPGSAAHPAISGEYLWLTGPHFLFL